MCRNVGDHDILVKTKTKDIMQEDINRYEYKTSTVMHSANIMNMFLAATTAVIHKLYPLAEGHRMQHTILINSHVHLLYHSMLPIDKVAKPVVSKADGLLWCNVPIAVDDTLDSQTIVVLSKVLDQCGVETLLEAAKGLELHYCQADYGQIFWDGQGNVITGIHDNDGEYRHEYMEALFKHFGIAVLYADDIPDFVKKWGGSDYFSDED